MDQHGHLDRGGKIDRTRDPKKRQRIIRQIFVFYNFRVSPSPRRKIEMIETKLSSGILSDW